MELYCSIDFSKPFRCKWMQPLFIWLPRLDDRWHWWPSWCDLWG